MGRELLTMSSRVWIIVGLGNPGPRYSKTRHNVGFRVIDRLAKDYRIALEEKDIAISGKGTIEGQGVVLLKPLTFMNRSGLAVRKALRKANILPGQAPGNLIVIHDDLDIETGEIKIRKTGSSGGHKGIESIIQEIGTRDFFRVKLGIGRDRNIPTDQYVLGTFRESEKNTINDAIINAAGAVLAVVNEGVERAMNKFNRTAKKSEPPKENA